MTGDDLDDLIDGGIRAYMAQEPPSGLEVRILRRGSQRSERGERTEAVTDCLFSCLGKLRRAEINAKST